MKFKMAFKGLVESQCGQENPLISLTHHFSRDKAPRASNLLSKESQNRGNLLNYKEGLSIDSTELYEEFLQERQNGNMPAPTTFQMDALLQEMHAINHPSPVHQNGDSIVSPANVWCEEYFDQFSKSQEATTNNKNSVSTYHPDWELEAEANWSKLVANEVSNTQATITPLKEDVELARTAQEVLETVDDPKFANTEFMKYMKHLSEGKSSNIAVNKWQDEFLSSKLESLSGSTSTAETWQSEFLMKSQPQTPHKHELWAQEFSEAQNNGSMKNVSIDSEAMNKQEKEEFWKILQKEWEDIAKQDNTDYSSSQHPWLSDFEADYGEPFKEYHFHNTESLKDHPDPLSEGKKCLELGDIPSAVLFFEAAVQKDSTDAEAWLLLGNTHAANEQDPSAIPALRKGLELDPSNLKGWMSLATSYTNESYQSLACRALEEWVKNNKEYCHLANGEAASHHPEVIVASIASREYLAQIQDLYLRAANLRHLGNIDSNVQCGLGILFNLTGDYDKATDCFQTALQVSPSDSHLWNKLGATLANSNKPAEAVDAYRNALDLSPGFIRCRYNLGIACINLGAHREALEHFLEALNMQKKSSSSAGFDRSLAMSDNIWSTVRVCLRSLGASHLLPSIDKRDLSKLNEEFGQRE